MFDYKIVITTSGIGSRLKELTKNTNKALIPINGRPTISYVLDYYPETIPLVFTVGYLAEQVKNFIQENYRNRKVEFVDINPYEGKGSSLGYSLLQAEKNLQCPFIFHACDTIILESTPSPSENWVGGYFNFKNQNLDPSHYRTQKIINGKIARLNEKGVADFDALHIGLTGIFDYKNFWQILRELYEKNPDFEPLSDVHVVEKMIEKGIEFKSKEFSTWLDTGNPSSLKETEEYLNSIK